jgi:hypothetical protein
LGMSRQMRAKSTIRGVAHLQRQHGSRAITDQDLDG